MLLLDIFLAIFIEFSVGITLFAPILKNSVLKIWKPFSLQVDFSSSVSFCGSKISLFFY